MSRHGFSDECDECDDLWAMIRFSGARASAIRGKRGQAFLRELLAAMDALPEPRLIEGELQHPATGEVCALGAVARARGLDVSQVDVEDYSKVAKLFGISETLAREIMFWNDEFGLDRAPKAGDAERRFRKVREAVLQEIRSSGALVPIG